MKEKRNQSLDSNENQSKPSRFKNPAGIEAFRSEIDLIFLDHVVQFKRMKFHLEKQQNIGQIRIARDFHKSSYRL